MTNDWENYYKETGLRAPRQTLISALNRFKKEGSDPGECHAIDLGSGNGRDTAELLRRGWRVTAIDSEPGAIAGLIQRQDLPEENQLNTILGRFELVEFPENVNLVNSSFALPLVAPEHFPDLWNKILYSLMPGGRISCQLYGDKDDWKGNPTITFFSRDGISALLNPLEIEFFEEEETDGTTPRGKHKHWHIFHIVARKI